jgi:hypothetical protein
MPGTGIGLTLDGQGPLIAAITAILREPAACSGSRIGTRNCLLGRRDTRPVIGVVAKEKSKSVVSSLPSFIPNFIEISFVGTWLAECVSDLAFEILCDLLASIDLAGVQGVFRFHGCQGKSNSRLQLQGNWARPSELRPCDAGSGIRH